MRYSAQLRTFNSYTDSLRHTASASIDIDLFIIIHWPNAISIVTSFGWFPINHNAGTQGGRAIAGGRRRVGYWFAVNGRAVAGHKTRTNWQRATGNGQRQMDVRLTWCIGSSARLGSAWRAETTATTAAASRPHNQFERPPPPPRSSSHCPFCGICTLRGSHFSRLFVIYLPCSGVTWPMQFSQASILLNIQQNVAKINCQRGESCIQRPTSAQSIFRIL